MLKCAEFIEKLEKNEITDFTEYLENAPIEYLVPMARRGIEVENLLKRGEETLVKTLIRNGHAQEYYDMWKHHSEPSVLIALAECGWFSDFFAKDKRCAIRAAVVVGNPSYIPKLMKRSATEREQCFEVLKQLTSPDPEILKAFMEYTNHKMWAKDKRRFELKYESMVKEPNVLESTMTPYTLFMANNPLWVRGISIDQLSYIDTTLEKATENGHIDLLEPIFDQMLTVKAAWEAEKMYREQLQKAGK